MENPLLNNRIMIKARRPGCGFTLLELLIVVAILMLVTVIAVPNVVVVLSYSRMRASITSFSGVLQSTRMLAVKENRTMTTHIGNQGQGLVAYAKLATDSNPLAVHDSQIEMEAPIVYMASPTGPNAPTAISTTVLGFTPETTEPSFNTRGMPCAYSTGTCPNKGFLYYFHDTRPGGKQTWAGVSISPAGRIHKWFWNGSAWTD
jgi:prepilin-type N-terminal cleavage/methylation domain-containing protein